MVVGGGGSDMWGTDAVYHIQSHISWVTANTNIFQFQIVSVQTRCLGWQQMCYFVCVNIK